MNAQEIAALKSICSEDREVQPTIDGEYMYSQCYWLKKWGFFPTSWHIPCSLDHAPNFYKQSSEYVWETFSGKERLFFNNLQFNAANDAGVDISKFKVVGAPVLFYKKLNRIEKKQNARGTIFFPEHSVPGSFELQMDIDEIIEQLRSLPAEYQPVTICLYYKDILNGTYKHYSDVGFNVVSAGVGRTPGGDFIERFYDYLTSHQYACSNSLTTPILYSIDLGIPSFLIKLDSYSVNSKKRNCMRIDKSEFDLDDIIENYHPEAKELVKTLYGLPQKVSASQKRIVNIILGADMMPTRVHMCLLLYKRYCWKKITTYWIREVRDERNDRKKILRAWKKWSRQLQPGSKIAIYGAGAHTKNMIVTLGKYFSYLNVIQVLDMNPATNTLCDIPVCKAESFEYSSVDFIIISSKRFEPEIFSFLLKKTEGSKIGRIYGE